MNILVILSQLCRYNQRTHLNQQSTTIPDQEYNNMPPFIFTLIVTIVCVAISSYTQPTTYNANPIRIFIMCAATIIYFCNNMKRIVIRLFLDQWLLLPLTTLYNPNSINMSKINK